MSGSHSMHTSFFFFHPPLLILELLFVPVPSRRRVVWRIRFMSCYFDFAGGETDENKRHEPSRDSLRKVCRKVARQQQYSVEEEEEDVE